MTALDAALRARRSRIGRRLAAARKAKQVRSLTSEPDRSLEDGSWEPEVEETVHPHYHDEMEEP